MRLFLFKELPIRLSPVGNFLQFLLIETFFKLYRNDRVVTPEFKDIKLFGGKKNLK